MGLQNPDEVAAMANLDKFMDGMVPLQVLVLQWAWLGQGVKIFDCACPSHMVPGHYLHLGDTQVLLAQLP